MQADFSTLEYRSYGRRATTCRGNINCSMRATRLFLSTVRCEWSNATPCGDPFTTCESPLTACTTRRKPHDTKALPRQQLVHQNTIQRFAPCYVCRGQPVQCQYWQKSGSPALQFTPTRYTLIRRHAAVAVSTFQHLTAVQWLSATSKHLPSILKPPGSHVPRCTSSHRNPCALQPTLYPQYS